MLSLKPILAIRVGRVEAIERVRTKPKAIDRLIALLSEEIPDGATLHAAVLHGQAPEDAAALAGRIAERFKPRELIKTEVGPVIGTHAGPGVVGAAFYVEP